MSASPRKRARLLVLASTYPRWAGDPEPGFVHELARRLVGRFDVTVLCPHAPGAPDAETLDGVDVVRYRYAPARLESLVNNGGIVTNLRRARWKWLLVPGFIAAQVFATWRLMRRERPDVVHAHWLLPQGLIAVVVGGRDGPPCVVTSHGADLFALRHPMLQAAKRFVARRAACLTVVSEAMREELQRLGTEAANIRVQPMGVDLVGRFAPDPAVARSRDEVLFVGRLVEKKGLRYLIDAMPEVLARHPTAYLTVAGFGPEGEERRRQVERLGLQEKVRFLGAVPQAELPALYRRAAVFVAPFVQAASGDQEGLGLVAVEAAGCGCPVVLSDLPATRDVFGDGAARVPPGSPADLSANILRVLGDPAAAAAHAAVARGLLAIRFDWRVVACAYGEILGAACGKPRSSP